VNGLILKIYVVKLKNLFIYIIFKILHTCAFNDEINFEKFKKVAKKLKEGVGIWTPVTLTFCMINPN
jgi:hypothetical protein